MNHIAFPSNKALPFVIVTLEYILYATLFFLFFERVRWGLAPLALVPVSAASWYFATRGGIFTAILTIMTNMILPVILGHSFIEFIESSGNLVGSTALLLVAVIVGRLGTVIRERRDALLRLESLEKERQARIDFLEMLGEITRKALEANDLDTSLRILLEDVGQQLFQADDCYFAFWDANNQLTIPVVACGSMKEIYPYVKFEPGEHTLTASVMKAGRPLAIENVEDSTLMSKSSASIFPNCSMLGLPLIAQDYRPAVLILGYNEHRKFDRFDLARAEIVAQHIALVLAKMQLLEDARKQIKQLTVLHKVSLLSTKAQGEDQLIEQVTDIIGESLFPDNFGMMLLDGESEILHAHASYRFFSDEELHMSEIPLGVGVTGQVAKMGQPIRVQNVHVIKNYVDIDKRTVSELCVPIKLQDRILGVINAESTKKDAFTEEDERLLVILASQLATAIEQLRSARAERQWLDQLAHSNDLIYSLAHITTHIERALSPDEIVQALGSELDKINLTCLMAIYDKTRELFTIKYTSIETEILDRLHSDAGFPLLEYVFLHDQVNKLAQTENISQAVVVSSPEDEIQVVFARENKNGIAKILQEVGISAESELMRLPLLFEDEMLGILWVWGNTITKSDLPVLSIFAKQIGISLERARLFQEVQSLALTDSLTGLQNRRSLFELGRIEFSRADRLNRPICCMMLDLDHFKQINDNHGHQVGDETLREFARRCKSSVREIDLVGRYGGEEILIILPETDRDTALQIAERVRVAIAESLIKAADREISVTVSIGVAARDGNTVDLETLIARADQAMYIAKHKGRNRVAQSR